MPGGSTARAASGRPCEGAVASVSRRYQRQVLLGSLDTGWDAGSSLG